MRKALLIPALLAVVALAMMPLAHAEVTTNEKIPFDMTFGFVDNDGNPHLLHLTGYLHVLSAYTLDKAGGFHLKVHSQPEGVSGEDLITGAKYQGTGVTQWEQNGKIGTEYTYINNFRLIGQGNAPNYLIHATYHYTINANGEQTAFVDNYRLEIK
jgi:hypothetical protein